MSFVKFRNFRFHYKGTWMELGERDGHLLMKYIGGRYKDSLQWDGNKVSLIELMKWIKENIPGSKDAKIELYFIIDGQQEEGFQFEIQDEVDFTYMWDEALQDSDKLTHLYVGLFPEASLNAFKELQIVKESIMNRTKSPPPPTFSPNRIEPNVAKKDITSTSHDIASTSHGGDHYEANTSLPKSGVADLSFEEQIGDLLLEKESVALKEDVGDKDLVNSVDDNVVVVKDRKGRQRVYDINRVEDGNEGDDIFFLSDEDDDDWDGHENEVVSDGVDRNDVISNEGVDNEVVSDGVDRNDVVSDEGVENDGKNKHEAANDESIAAKCVITPAWDTEFLQNSARIEEHCVFDRKDDGEFELHEGQIWETAKLCRQYIREHAIKKKFALILPKNNKDKIIGVCKAEKCKWRIYIRMMNDGHSMRLKKLEDAHSCVGRVVTKNPTANAPWIAQQVVEEMRSHHKSYTPLDIKELIWRKKNLIVEYWQAWNARTLALEIVHGSFEGSYARLPELCRQVHSSNPRSIAAFSRDHNTLSFTSFCLMFKGSIDGFNKGCRPFIGLDGCHLKGKYGGYCLAVVAMDGDNGLFPIAIYICVNENLANWNNFLEKIAPYISARKLTIMSDRQKGLDAAVNIVFPGCHQRFCVRHITTNIRQFHRGVERFTWGASKAYTQLDFVKFMNSIKKSDILAWDYLMKIPKSVWARSAFDKDCCVDHVTNNISESFNAFILAARDMPVTGFALKYQTLVMKQQWDRKCEIEKWDVNKLQGIVPRAKEIYDKYCSRMGDYAVSGCNGNEWQVSQFFGKIYKVDMEARQCSCNEWQITGMPCVHAVCIIEPRRLQLTLYFSHYFSIEAYKETYKGCIYPVLGDDDWPENDEQIYPPLRTREPGRPRVNRIRGANEGRPPNEQIHNRCSGCGGYNHNIRTCQGGTPNDPPRRRRWEPNRGGRPRLHLRARPPPAEDIGNEGAANVPPRQPRTGSNQRWRAKRLVDPEPGIVEPGIVTPPEVSTPPRTERSSNPRNVAPRQTRSMSTAATRQTRSKTKNKLPMQNTADTSRRVGNRGAVNRRAGSQKTTSTSNVGTKRPSTAEATENTIVPPPAINVPFKKPRQAGTTQPPATTIQQRNVFRAPSVFPFRGTSNSNIPASRVATLLGISTVQSSSQQSSQASSSIPPWKP